MWVDVGGFYTLVFCVTDLLLVFVAGCRSGFSVVDSFWVRFRDFLVSGFVGFSVFLGRFVMGLYLLLLIWVLLVTVSLCVLDT